MSEIASKASTSRKRKKTAKKANNSCKVENIVNKPCEQIDFCDNEEMANTSSKDDFRVIHKIANKSCIEEATCEDEKIVEKSTKEDDLSRDDERTANISCKDNDFCEVQKIANKFCEQEDTADDEKIAKESEEQEDSCKDEKIASKSSEQDDSSKTKGTDTEHKFYEAISKQDIYVRKAKEQGWRCRSAFKLLQIDEKFNIFEDVVRAVDLFARTGVWTQVLSRRLYMGETVKTKEKYCLFYTEFDADRKLKPSEKYEYRENKDVQIVAVEDFGIPSYPGVIQIDSMRSTESMVEFILNHFKGNKADLVVSSKVFNYTGINYIDINVQANQVVHILHIACQILKEGGTLVVAIFEETNNDLVKLQLSSIFKEVDIFKPKCSKTSSKELFAVCRQYSPPEGFDAKYMTHFLEFANKDFSSLTGINKVLIPFLVCGDLSIYPLSAEDEDFYKNNCTMPVDELVPHSYRFKSEAMNEYLDKINEALESLGLKSNPDLDEMKTVKRRFEEVSGASSSNKNEEHPNCSKDEEEIYDRGPLYDLIQKTTKIKKYPPENTPQVPVHRGFHFLDEDEFTDPDGIKEYLEYVNIDATSSSCTCDDNSP